MRKLYSILVLAVLMLSLNSCDERHRYHDPILGSWEAVSYVEGNYEYNINPQAYHRYSFYEDGTGIYVDDRGYRYDFIWDYGGSYQLRLRYHDGSVDWLYYDFDGRYLLLSTDYDFFSYYVYDWY